jgi:hypothetical protein
MRLMKVAGVSNSRVKHRSDVLVSKLNYLEWEIGWRVFGNMHLEANQENMTSVKHHMVNIWTSWWVSCLTAARSRYSCGDLPLWFHCVFAVHISPYDWKGREADCSPSTAFVEFLCKHIDRQLKSISAS